MTARRYFAATDGELIVFRASPTKVYRSATWFPVSFSGRPMAPTSAPGMGQCHEIVQADYDALIAAKNTRLRSLPGRGDLDGSPQQSWVTASSVVMSRGWDKTAPGYSDKHGTFFGRVTDTGTVAVLHVRDGEPATRLDASVYPIGSQLSAYHEHPEGIVLSRQDAVNLGLAIEV